MAKDININCTINEMRDSQGNKISMVSEKHFNGYVYDSLCFRYKDARYKQADFEINDILYEKNCDRIEAKRIAYKRADRDFYNRKPASRHRSLCRPA